MVLFGDGSVAQVVLSTGNMAAPGGSGYGQYQSISWGWGLGVMLGIYVAGLKEFALGGVEVVSHIHR